MPSPFPGMDPFIEAQGNWQDFHNRLSTEICNMLGVRLPDDYVSRVDERIEVMSFDGPTGPQFLPDILVTREDTPRRGSLTTATLPVLKPISMEVAASELEESRHTWLEIRKLPDLELVTVIEVLSPVNKLSVGRAEYLAKRDRLHRARVNLVEIDLLIGGLRVPMKQPLPPAHYYTIIGYGQRLPIVDVYPWTLHDRLPTIPIPLQPPDPDVPIDLQELADRVYDLGRYQRTLKYQQPLPATFPISAEDRAWAEAFGSTLAK